MAAGVWKNDIALKKIGAEGGENSFSNIYYIKRVGGTVMMRKELERLIVEAPETPCYEVWGKMGEGDECLCSAYFDSEDAEEEMARLQYASAQSLGGCAAVYWLKETTLGEYVKRRKMCVV